MTAISYVRYDILKNKKNEKSIGNKIIIISVIISFLLSLFWSAAPILGWSYYSLEEGLGYLLYIFNLQHYFLFNIYNITVSCSVEYSKKSLNVITYNFGMFIFVFILPFGITIYANLRSLFIVNI